MYAEVAVLVPLRSAGPQETTQPTFHYAIPPDLEGRLRPGHLVTVPFGPRRQYGIVVGLSETSPVPAEELRPLEALVDPEPVVTAEQVRLARWMADYYLAPLATCFQTMLPPGVVGSAETLVTLLPGVPLPETLTPAQREIITLLQRRGPLRSGQLDRVMRRERWRRAVDRLAAQGIVSKRPILTPPRARPQAIRTVHLAATDAEIAAARPQLGRSSRQADLLDWLATSPDPLPRLERVREAVGCSLAPIQALARRGWIALIPAQTLVESTLSREAIEEVLTDTLSRAPAQAAVLQTLRDAAAPLPAGQFPSAPLRALIRRGYVRRIETPALVQLLLSPDEARRRADELRGGDVYRRILDLLRREPEPVDVSWVYAQARCRPHHLKRLADLGLVAFGSAEVWRDPLAEIEVVPESPPPLTPDQRAVWEAIAPSLTSEEPVTWLLHGVTGSGKTEIYLRAVAATLEQGRGAIVLVPEISLTPQTVRRFVARFPGRVALLHSRLSEGERYDTWRRIRAGELPIVVGPRSALFAPLPRPGLIVLDEEHDTSYKQDRPPYYHARTVALARARLTGAVVILGSATPSLESYHRARQGDFRLLTLPQRIRGYRRRIEAQRRRFGLTVIRYRQETAQAVVLPLPQVQVVDMRQELRAGHRHIFSRALQRAMAETLERGEQVILFLNRRGAATHVFCRDCGHVMTCPRCDIPLTQHHHPVEGGEGLPASHLVCHYCDHREPAPARCPACGSTRIRYFGLGTQGVEEAVRTLFPQARLLRWDRDTTGWRGAHDLFLRRFVEGQADVLVGTQMIAKGLDLPLVTLVGIVSADTALHLPDFRAAERTFQLLVQVAGRAGRGLRGGRVILQTYHPEHYAIRAAAAHDYSAFARRELAFREEMGYPPYGRLARLLYRHTQARKARQEAEALAEAIRERLREEGRPATDLIGPAPAFFARLRGAYRWHLLLRHPDPAALLRQVPIPPGWRVDVDPVDLL